MFSMDRRRVVFAVLALLVTTATGAPALAQQSGGGESDRFATVKSGRDGLSFLQIGEPIFSQAGAGLRVQFSVTNGSRRDETIEYRVDWFDESGVALPGSIAWRTIFLGPSEQGVISSVGAYQGAYSARCTLRRVRTRDQ
jgi:uncharacterized protein YcfL